MVKKVKLGFISIEAVSIKSYKEVKYARNLVTKILNLEINYKELNILFKQKLFDSNFSKINFCVYITISI